MVAFYKHLISTGTEMLVLSKATVSRDRKKPKPQQTKLIQKNLPNKNQRQPLPIPKIIKILPKINLKTSFHEVLIMMFNGSKLWSSAA